jgi:hypothetical protein
VVQPVAGPLNPCPLSSDPEPTRERRPCEVMTQHPTPRQADSWGQAPQFHVACSTFNPSPIRAALQGLAVMLAVIVLLALVQPGPEVRLGLALGTSGLGLALLPHPRRYPVLIVLFLGLMALVHGALAVMPGGFGPAGLLALLVALVWMIACIAVHWFLPDATMADFQAELARARAEGRPLPPHRAVEPPPDLILFLNANPTVTGRHIRISIALMVAGMGALVLTAWVAGPQAQEATLLPLLVLAPLWIWLAPLGRGLAWPSALVPLGQWYGLAEGGLTLIGVASGLGTGLFVWTFGFVLTVIHDVVTAAERKP